MSIRQVLGTACTILLANCIVVTAFSQEKKPLVADSLKSKVNSEIKRELAEAKGKLQLPTTDTLLPLKALKGKKGELIGELNSLLSEPKAIQQQLLSKMALFDDKKIVKPGRVNASVEYTYLQDTSGMELGSLNSLGSVYSYDFSTGITLFQLPVNFSFRGMNGVYTSDYTSFNKLFKFNFDHQKYIQTIQSKVADKLDPDVLTAFTMNRINAIKSNYEKALRSEISELQNEYAQKYKSFVALPEGVTDLSKNDRSVLRSKLFAEAKANSAAMADSAMAGNEAHEKRVELLEKIYQKIISDKDKFENNKLVKQLKSNLPFTRDSYKSFLKQPGNLDKIVDEHMELSTIQRLFMNMTKVDLGQNAVKDGDFSLQNVINSGVNTEFKNKKVSGGFIYGRNNNINNWLQAGLTSGVTNEYSSMTGFKLGTGSGSASQQFIAVNFFDFKDFPQLGAGDNPLQSAYMAVPQRRDATISFHSGFEVAPKHKIVLDVSKSFGSYSNNMSPDSQAYKTNAYNNLLGGDGKSNYAAMVDYKGEILNSDVTVFIKKVGLGYNNPGNVLLRSGETKVGFGVVRKVVKQMTVKYNIDFSKRDFDPLKRYTNRSINNKLQLNYRINRNNRVGLTWQHTSYDSRLLAAGESKGGNTRIQADGAYSVRVAGRKVTNNVTISHQQMNIPMLLDENYKSRSVLLMHTSSIALNRNPLSITFLLNRSDNKDYLFNTSLFTAEANYSYQVAKTIRLGNSIGYYDNVGWNKQAGIKQQASATLKEWLNIDVDLTYKKAVDITRPELANQLFITAGMHLNF
ncbi:hypothetical protein FAM09_09145 [Niastella caeni]|uniref:Uncharacterized protein n=1 Tax=Niastella caeni TaxID=2569763 RepID=A0A4S8HXM0_9BACT|nr:hypothetical protein [Niastella caeni]THU40041.1 hypothetical protein FAM09_09145 [Niastella caeni]